jgi:amino acid transporter
VSCILAVLLQRRHLLFHRSYIGYSNANYALSEVRDPIRTIKRAAPSAMILVTLAYVAVNVAYFAVVSKQDMLEGGTMAAYGSLITQTNVHVKMHNIFRALFFRNIFGPATGRVSGAYHGPEVGVVSYRDRRS